MKRRPDVAVAKHPQVAKVGLLTPHPDSLSDALHHLVMRVGTLAFRVDSHGDDGGLDGTELVEDDVDVVVMNRALRRNQRPLVIQPQPQMMYMAQRSTTVSPDKLLLKLTDFTFEFLYLGTVG